MLWVIGGVVLAIVGVSFTVLLWTTLEAAREFYQRENQKHRSE